MINIIVAIDLNGGIGKNGSLPWNKIPSDMKRFRTTTDNSIVIMGRKTFDSIGKPLPNRINIIISSRFGKKIFILKDETIWVDSLETAKEYAQELSEREQKQIFVIGGESIYEYFLPFSKRLFVTMLEAEFDCDTYFPCWKWDDPNWEMIDNFTFPDEPYRPTFATWHRNSSPPTP